jgi:hypothetical protein
MDRYKETDFDIMEAIKNSPAKGMYFADLAKLRPDTAKLHKLLKKWVSRNYLTEQNDFNGVYYCIKETNQEMQLHKVICPICKTVRRTHRDNQHAIHCSNPDCISSSGRHRTFWLVNIDHLRRGAIKRINYS